MATGGLENEKLIEFVFEASLFRSVGDEECTRISEPAQQPPGSGCHHHALHLPHLICEWYNHPIPHPFPPPSSPYLPHPHSSPSTPVPFHTPPLPHPSPFTVLPSASTVLPFHIPPSSPLPLCTPPFLPGLSPFLPISTPFLSVRDGRYIDITVYCDIDTPR